jgi:hypothetical protein
VDDRDVLGSQAFRRWQMFLAFTRGSHHSGEALVKRPNRPLYAGVAVTLVVCLVVAVKTLLAHGPPSDWNAEGNLVVDKEAGGRYLVSHGALRPVLNLTSLDLLTGGAAPRSVQVAHALLARQRRGQPIGILGAPDQPPVLLGPSARWVACEGGRNAEVDLLVGVPDAAGAADPGAPGGILARAAGDATTYLVTGPGAFALGSQQVLQRLGYTPDLIRTVPKLWLDLLPRVAVLRPQPLPAGPGGAAPPSAPFMADGTVVVDRSSGVQYLAAAGSLHRVRNRTSLLLLERQTRGPTQVPADAIAAQPLGAPFGIAAAPASPPALPEGTSPLFACAQTGAKPVAVLARPPVAAGLVRAAPPAGATSGAAAVRAWMAPDRGVLARPSTTAFADVSPSAPVYLVTAGVAYPVTSDGALGALGYQREQARPLPPAWLAALPRGPALEVQRTARGG